MSASFRSVPTGGRWLRGSSDDCGFAPALVQFQPVLQGRRQEKSKRKKRTERDRRLALHLVSCELQAAGDSKCRERRDQQQGRNCRRADPDRRGEWTWL